MTEMMSIKWFFLKKVKKSKLSKIECVDGRALLDVAQNVFLKVVKKINNVSSLHFIDFIWAYFEFNLERIHYSTGKVCFQLKILNY